jgi:hypothetical protein
MFSFTSKNSKFEFENLFFLAKIPSEQYELKDIVRTEILHVFWHFGQIPAPSYGEQLVPPHCQPFNFSYSLHLDALCLLWPSPSSLMLGSFRGCFMLGVNGATSSSWVS